jgi:hypothetical protein
VPEQRVVVRRRIRIFIWRRRIGGAGGGSEPGPRPGGGGAKTFLLATGIAFVVAVAGTPAARSALSTGESATSASQNLRGKSTKNRNSQLTPARVASRGFRIASHVADDGNVCASHSYGEVQDFFRRNPCVALHRETYVLEDQHGDGKVLVAYASVEMKDTDQARRLQEVLDKDGSGNVTELSRERGAYRSVRYDDAVFASERDGTVVVNAQAKFVQGKSRKSDLELIAHDAIR